MVGVDIVSKLSEPDCDQKTREVAAELIVQYRAMVNRMVDSVFSVWYAADLKRARQDVMANAICDECAGKGGHSDCEAGLRGCLSGFEHMNRLTRDALGLRDGESLSVVLERLSKPNMGDS